ncbi:hypothetical protein KHC17_16940 [Agrobacterium salinitolerans]|uniref:hypothetical protein n=1 Tax=Agrobacterium salinitolerans TaxID=1183413 RepID=UPI001C20FAAC|nr:hypothetical protein [Agrobacterium salinitolerans]QXC49548.1 hypothetical protein KHC17_16940 [Agrobacterium salinitolerans]
MDSIVRLAERKVWAFWRHTESPTYPQTCLLRVVVVGAQLRVLMWVKGVMRRPENVGENTDRVLPHPRRTGQKASHTALLGDDRSLRLKVRVRKSLCFEPSRAAHRDVSARREASHKNHAVGPDQLTQQIGAFDDGAGNASYAAARRSLTVLGVDHDNLIAALNPGRSHCVGQVAEEDDYSSAVVVCVLQFDKTPQFNVVFCLPLQDDLRASKQGMTDEFADEAGRSYASTNRIHTRGRDCRSHGATCVYE